MVADITDLESIENAANWKKQISEHVANQMAQFDYNNGIDEDDEDKGIPMLLVLNKYDLVEELVDSNHELEEFMTFDYLQKFAEDYGFIGAVCTSAKSGVGVTQAVSALVRQILIRELQPDQNESIDRKNTVT